MIDSHTHLASCQQPEAELVAAAAAVGVSRIVTVGTDAESCRLALAAAERHPEVYAACGLHPNEAAGCQEADLELIAQLARHPRCVAIGETGLDYYHEHAPHSDQQRAFRAQIEIARELQKPVVIHTREAADDTLATLAEHADGVKVILHCFSMPERIEECLERPDWFISFAGNITYPANAALRTAMLTVPAGRLLVETDAPYLTPVPLRGSRNVPANVVHTAAAIALERRIAYAQLEREVEAAAAAAFSW
ncbi:TatD family hydrolase [Conexibacter sp. S30A1]|uniref:TatD family hydrolase n=1 Tax=Conexibacter sp. S30A1 TaxID=2937800 RepID=UPI00200D844F|nr:TatD family hydrolase [Conexibacter sp. S30A1]